MDIVGYVFLGFIALAILIALGLLISALPDIARYARIRKM
jgi:hypothetical protein